MEDQRILAEHYQKTYELTFELWRQRNRMFLILLGVIGLATLLTFGGDETKPLLVAWIAASLGMTGGRVDALERSFPLGLLHSLLLMVIFYLIVNLYHRSVSVSRLYHYLGDMEREIRERLGLPEDTVSFTRESGYYWAGRSPSSSAVKWFYVCFLGALLAAFMGGRIYFDFTGGNIPLGIVDLLVSIPIAAFYAAYAHAAIALDKPTIDSRRSGG